MCDHYSCILYDTMKTRRKCLKNHEIVTLNGLYTFVDAILFFVLFDVILREM